MILKFSEKGSPYVEFDEHNRFIFSRMTANVRGIKYMMYTNSPLDGSKPLKERDNWMTTMYFKNARNGSSLGNPVTNLGVPHSFKSNPYWKDGSISILKRMIKKYLLPTGEFPEKCFPDLAEDIIKFNELNDDDRKKLIHTVKEQDKEEEESGVEKKKRGRKPKVKSELPVTKKRRGRKPKAQINKKRRGRPPKKRG